MKHLARFLTISALLTTGSYAAPFLTVGDGAEVFFTGTLGARADSNIFLGPDKQKDKSDTVFDVAPGLELVFGKGAAVQGSWSVKEDVSSYSSHSKLNSNLFSTNFSAGYTDGKTKGSVNASYAETNQNQVDDTTNPLVPLDFLIRRNSTNLGAAGEVAATEKTSVGAGVQYAKTEYQRKGFSNSDVVTVPVNYYYEATPKVDLSLGYQYRGTWQKIGEDSVDNFFNVGARGEFTPKLSGQFNVGLTRRSFTHRGDVSLLGVDSNLTYLVSPKTSLQFGVGNDFDANSQGDQQKNFSVHVSATSSISDQWSVTTSLSYRAINYFDAVPARTDNYVEGQIGATYIVSTNIQITGAYTYRANQSDLGSLGFGDNVLSIAANFRY